MTIHNIARGSSVIDDDNVPNQTIRIPLAPLKAYIERVGGFAGVHGLGVPRDDYDEAGKVTHKIDRTFEEALRYKRLRNKISEATRQGWISLTQADEICCDFLHVHPAVVYGWDWFEFEPEDEEQGAPLLAVA